MKLCLHIILLERKLNGSKHLVYHSFNLLKSRIFFLIVQIYKTRAEVLK